MVRPALLLTSVCFYRRMAGIVHNMPAYRPDGVLMAGKFLCRDNPHRQAGFRGITAHDPVLQRALPLYAGARAGTR